jgi:NADPH:quinone reductase-like Zn-dependent oxidoreductase
MGGGSQTLSTLGAMALVLGRGLFSRFLRQQIRMFVARIRQADLDFLAGLCASRKMTPVIDRAYPLAEAAEAVRRIEDGHPRGKVLVIP